MQEVEDNIISNIDIIYNKLIKMEENINYKLQLIQTNNKINYMNFFKIYSHLIFIDISIFAILIPYIYIINRK